MHIFLLPDNPSLLGAMMSQRSPVLVSLQRKRFLGCERLRLLRCSGALSALLICPVAVVYCRGRADAQHKVVDRIMRRFSSDAHRLRLK
jgi:hypothetical protein